VIAATVVVDRAKMGMDQSFVNTALELTAPGRPLEETLARESPDELLALLYRQMRALAGPRQDLDDLVQAAAERALKALERFEGRSSLSTFTYGIVYRTLIDQQRWYRRFQRRFSLDTPEQPDELTFPRSSETDLRELERARRLYAALDQLPNEKRATLILHDLEGLDVADVAAISGANEGTVRSRLRDAHKKLAEILRQDPLFDPEVPV
jgi:RNA polymerase sigma-70 factor (ECF subfamily)